MNENTAARPKSGWAKVRSVFLWSLLVGWAVSLLLYLTGSFRWHPEDPPRFIGNVFMGPAWAFTLWGLWLLMKAIGRGAKRVWRMIGRPVSG